MLRPPGGLARAPRYGRPLLHQRPGAGYVLAAGSSPTTMIAPRSLSRPAAGDAQQQQQRFSAQHHRQRRGRFHGQVSVWRFLSRPAAPAEQGAAGGPRPALGTATSRASAQTMGRGHRGQAGRASLLADHDTIPPARRELRRARCRSSGSAPVPADHQAATAHGRREDRGARQINPPASRPRSAAYDAAQRPGRFRPARSARLGQGPAPPPVLAHRLLGPAPAGLPGAMLTLGGRWSRSRTGQVRRPDGTAVPGLYATGRSAAGRARTPTQRAFPGRLRLLRPPGRAACRGGRAGGVRRGAEPAADQRR